MGFQGFKGAVLKGLFLDKQVGTFYLDFQKQHPNFTKNNHFEAIRYILRLNYAQYKYRDLNKVPLPKSASKYKMPVLASNKQAATSAASSN